MLITEPNEAYHASEGVGKTFLWQLYDRTPFHARYVPKRQTNAFDIGRAGHIAVLEPELLEKQVLNSGLPDRMQRNAWKAAQDEAAAKGMLCMTQPDYEMALIIRDVAATVPEVQLLQRGKPIVERSCYHVDEETGVTVKCRPDIYSAEHCIMADLKIMADASPFAWQRDSGKYGYHMQDAIYSDVWERGSGMPVDAFFFFVFEKSMPPIVQCYELPPSSKAEGFAAYRKALAIYKECVDNDHWPAYGGGVKQVGIRRQAHKLTDAPQEEEIQAMGDDDA